MSPAAVSARVVVMVAAFEILVAPDTDPSRIDAAATLSAALQSGQAVLTKAVVAQTVDIVDTPFTTL